MRLVAPSSGSVSGTACRYRSTSTARTGAPSIPTSRSGIAISSYFPSGTADEQAVALLLCVLLTTPLQCAGEEYLCRGWLTQMIFGVAHIVSYLSRFMALQPGDVIPTGTPPGVGMGMKPPVFLKPGDVIRLGGRGLGEQQQRVVPSPLA